MELKLKYTFPRQVNNILFSCRVLRFLGDEDLGVIVGF